ncbi:MAG TPA: polyprenyl synthetase family protein [Ktedonobacterales bacterium]|nr:polyprenyl synthetase family protein [Ktedonobacterales bacterium]
MSSRDSASSVSPAHLDTVLGRYWSLLGGALREAIHAGRAGSATPATNQLLDEFYNQIEYHHGWRTPDLQPRPWQPGKLLRPTLALLACELAAGQAGTSPEAAVHRAIPAAVAVEMVHNFSLVHDDIEDGDDERHHQPTLWKLWGIPQAINTGDGIFALARLELRHLCERGVPAETVLQISAQLDATCVELCEGQFLDMSFEGRRDVSVAMYLDMIGRKAAALMDCATRTGSLIGAPDNEALSGRLGAFGRALGMGFQLRDDILGIWSAVALGKTEAGDLRRKKMSLPVIAALEHAAPADQRALTAIYDEPGPATEAQITTLLAILERTGARERARAMLREQCNQARGLLASVCATATASDACAALGVLLDFVAAEGI